jgi:cytochrome c-type protein NapB
MIAGLGAAALALVAIPGAGAQDADVESLRGPASIEEMPQPPVIQKQNIDAGRFTRAYRQQPPLIPHRIDKYEIDLKVNQCMRCHDWPYNVDENAPKISETHYIDRNGVALDYVARTRWFCTQCHVPQARAPSLVRNEFKSAFDLE